MACGVMIFIKKINLKKNVSYYFISFIFLVLLLLHKTLKGSQNIQGFELIRAVLFGFKIKIVLNEENKMHSILSYSTALSLIDSSFKIRS